MGFRFEVNYPDRKPETLTVDADEALVGSGAHCEIRIQAEEIEVEHLLVRMTAQGVHVRARSAKLPKINGVEFAESMIPEGAAIRMGSIELKIALVDISGGAAIKKKAKGGTSPMAYVGLIGILGLAAWLLLDDSNHGGPNTAMPEAIPSLWPAPMSVCAVSEPEQARAKASELWIVANARAERRPFRIQDGVTSVPAFEQAAACFGTGGDLADKTRASEVARILRSKIEEEYRLHRVRLEHALNVGDSITALKEVRVLRQFLEQATKDPKTDVYVGWLAEEDRKLTIAVDHMEKKKK
jgi:hypothetical protein